jgi:hypothetical protein
MMADLTEHEVAFIHLLGASRQQFAYESIAWKFGFGKFRDDTGSLGGVRRLS